LEFKASKQAVADNSHYFVSFIGFHCL